MGISASSPHLCMCDAVARASDWSAHSTSPNSTLERFVLSRKDSAARSTGQPVYSIAHKVSSPTCVGLVRDSVKGPRVQGAQIGTVKLAGGSWMVELL